MPTFTEYLEYLEDIGFYEVALPFLLIFTLTFAILQKVKIFGEHSKNFNAVIAAAMAFLVVRNPAVVETMNTFLPNVSLIALIIVSALLLIGILLGKEGVAFQAPFGGVAAVIVLIAVIISFLLSSGALGIELPSSINYSTEDIYFWLSVLAFIIFVFYITSEPGSKGPDNYGVKNFFEGLNKTFGAKP